MDFGRTPSGKEGGVLDGQIFAFLGVAALLIVTPGPDMALIAKHALGGGQRAGLLASAGVLTGLVGWALLAALGLAALLSASATAFAVLKLAGSAYLVFIGLQTLWQSRQTPAADTDLQATPSTNSRLTPYRQGLFSNLLNPKVGLFYTTFLPQFVAADDPFLTKTVLLALLHLILSVAWLVWYVRIVVKASEMLRRPIVRRWLDRTTGAVLVGLGLRLAMERR